VFLVADRSDEVNPDTLLRKSRFCFLEFKPLSACGAARLGKALKFIAAFAAVTGREHGVIAVS